MINQEQVEAEMTFILNEVMNVDSTWFDASMCAETSHLSFNNDFIAGTMFGLFQAKRMFDTLNEGRPAKEVAAINALATNLLQRGETIITTFEEGRANVRKKSASIL